VVGQLHDPATLQPGKKIPATNLTGDWLDPQSQSRSYDKEKKFLSLSWVQTRLSRP